MGVGAVCFCLCVVFLWISDQSGRSSYQPMTSLAYIHDRHSCYDERSIDQKKNLPGELATNLIFSLLFPVVDRPRLVLARQCRKKKMAAPFLGTYQFGVVFLIVRLPSQSIFELSVVFRPTISLFYLRSLDQRLFQDQVSVTVVFGNLVGWTFFLF